MTATEYVILVDQTDQEIGIAEKLAAHRENRCHRAFSIFIFRYINHPEQLPELLLQQRALDKYHSAGLWTNTCCSHPRPGEAVITAGERRLQEEFGIKADLRDIGWFHYIAPFDNGLTENEVDHVLLGEIHPDTLLLPHPQEIHDYRWITLTNLVQEMDQHPERFTPWLAKAFELIQMNKNKV